MRIRFTGIKGGKGSGCCTPSTPCDPSGGCTDLPARSCTWVYIHGGVTSTATTPTGCIFGVSHGGGLAIFDGGCGGSNVGPGFRFDMSCGQHITISLGEHLAAGIAHFGISCHKSPG